MRHARLKRRARQLLGVAAVVWILSLVFSSAVPAAADISGPCTASIAGVDANAASSPGDAVEVDQHSQVPMAMQTTNGASLTSHRIGLEFAGFSRNVSSGTDNSPQFKDTVNVDQYATYGVGLYKVKGSATLTSGAVCSGDMYVKVKGNPLTTVAGAAGAGATGIGVATVVVLGTLATSEAGLGTAITDAMEVAAQEEEAERRRLQQERLQDEINAFSWLMFGCMMLALPGLILTGMTLASGGGVSANPEPAVRLPRVSWRPRISVLSCLGGLLAGAGTVVVLQQYAVLFPSRAVAIEGLAGGLAVGLVIPSLGRVWALRRINRAIGRAEKRLNRTHLAHPEPLHRVPDPQITTAQEETEQGERLDSTETRDVDAE